MPTFLMDIFQSDIFFMDISFPMDILPYGQFTDSPFYPIFKDHFFVFKEVFQKILSLCMACIQERLVIKSGL